MEEKGLFFVLALALCALVLFVYLGLRTYKSLKEMPAPQPAEVPARTSRPITSSTPDYLASGREHYDQGNYAAALEAFRKAQAADPQNPSIKQLVAGAEAMTRVQTAMLARKWADAEAACREAAKYPISAVDARRKSAEIAEYRSYDENYKKGQTAFENGDYESARAAFAEARRVADRMGITSDAQQKVEKMQGLAVAAAQAGKDAEWVLSVCSDRGNPYATYAALSYFLSSNVHKPRHAAYRTQLEATKKFIEANRAKFPSPRQTSTLRYDVLRMENGDVLKGQVIEKTDKIVKLRVEKEGKTIIRTLLAGEVTDIAQETLKPDALNQKRAEEVLTQAVAQLASKHPFQALASLGILAYEFPDVSLMKDTDKQQSIISTTTMGTALQGGPTIQRLTEVCIQQCQSVCGKCEGTATLPCPECKGQGSVASPCALCNAAGKLLCTTCNGAGRLPTAPGVFARCAVCSGKGASPCPECKGSKISQRPCVVCNGAKTVTCTSCLGGGQRTR